MAEKPNVLFVFSDQMRGSAMGCAGTDEVATPTMDRIAAEGTRFDHAYANYPLCSPSRATLLTGQYPLTNRVIDNDLPLPGDVPGVAKAFGEAGYRTGYVGKWHLDGVPRDRWTPPGPRRQGFDDFWAVYNCSHDYFDAAYYRDTDDPVAVDGYEPVAQTDLALEFLRADDDRPFCLFLSWGPPHDPYRMVPERYRSRYDPDDLTLPPNAAPILPGHDDHPAPPLVDAPPVREFAGPGDVFDEPARYDYDHPREGLADYYAAITALDDQLGRLVDALDEEGLADDTVLAYSSDHGDMLWSQGRNQKGAPYEESINVPFLIRWPGEVPAGRVDDTLLGLVDVAPSLLSLTGVAPPPAMEGTDLSDAFRGRDIDGPDSVFLANIRRGWRGVRTRQYTYARLSTHDDSVAHLPGDREWLLFDNDADPFQSTNLVLDREYDADRARLSSLLDEWLERLDDPFLTVEGHVHDLDMVETWNERERVRNPEDPSLR
jgi:arylsulfatase A-like enzyme